MAAKQTDETEDRTVAVDAFLASLRKLLLSAASWCAPAEPEWETEREKDPRTNLMSLRRTGRFKVEITGFEYQAEKQA